MSYLDTRGGEGWRYAGIDQPAPDEARRPISIARLADSLSIPFETTRRTVHKLIGAGLCLRVDGGVIIPQSAAQQPVPQNAMCVNVGYVRTFFRDLARVGFVEPAALAWEEEAPESVGRLVWRLSGDYVLRAIGLLIGAYGDIRAAVVMHTIFTANIGYLDKRGGKGERFAAIDKPPPDQARRPISIGRLSESLGMPFETTRRHVRSLISAGFCVRVEGGIIVPQAVLGRPEPVSGALANLRYVRRFVRDLTDAVVNRQERLDSSGYRADRSSVSTGPPWE